MGTGVGAAAKGPMSEVIAAARLYEEANATRPSSPTPRRPAGATTPSAPRPWLDAALARTPPQGGPTRARWRAKVLNWLRNDLNRWEERSQGDGGPKVRAIVRQQLEHWKADPDLADLREPAELVKLPEVRRDECKRLWEDVDALLASARSRR